MKTYRSTDEVEAILFSEGNGAEIVEWLKGHGIGAAYDRARKGTGLGGARPQRGDRIRIPRPGGQLIATVGMYVAVSLAEHPPVRVVPGVDFERRWEEVVGDFTPAAEVIATPTTVEDRVIDGVGEPDPDYTNPEEGEA